MSLFSQIFAISIFFIIISAILYVIFGQVTVRKLRKNPNTKDELGIEFASVGIFSTLLEHLRYQGG